MFGRHVVFLFVLVLIQSSHGQITPAEPPITLLSGYVWSDQTNKDSISASILREDGFSIFYSRPDVREFYSKFFEVNRNIIWRKDQTVNGRLFTAARLSNGEIVIILDQTEILRARPNTIYDTAEVLLTAVAFAQGAAQTQIDPSPTVPGNIRLLPGYVHRPLQGIDSKPGTIQNESSLSVGYDIGKMAANYSAQYFPEHFERLRRQTHLNSDTIERRVKYLQDQVLWRQRQKVNGEELRVVHLKAKKLIASFAGSSANFFAELDSEEKLVDFFLMVLTYQPKAEKSG